MKMIFVVLLVTFLLVSSVYAAGFVTAPPESRSPVASFNFGNFKVNYVVVNQSSGYAALNAANFQAAFQFTSEIMGLDEAFRNRNGEMNLVLHVKAHGVGCSNKQVAFQFYGYHDDGVEPEWAAYESLNWSLAQRMGDYFWGKGPHETTLQDPYFNPSGFYLAIICQ